jgi:hypothetical protein
MTRTKFSNRARLNARSTPDSFRGVAHRPLFPWGYFQPRLDSRDPSMQLHDIWLAPPCGELRMLMHQHRDHGNSRRQLLREAVP